ncbi:MAG TPA: response regulator [Puia sp.]|uniref:response regulator n=1 Tax=Puia sp. TaxID=2045100 RepID=UPI002CB43B34|nr:response regulator [Puia sp.]HVU98033.1 response regulator [Puia sp.]
MAHLKKIMIVDDDADHLLAVNLIFQRKGYEVRPLLGCESLEMLREEVRRFRPDLIFMDHDMPVVCGSDAVKMLKSHPVYRRIPIVYFSAHDRIEALARAAGADTWLKKPYVLNRLMEVTEQFL